MVKINEYYLSLDISTSCIGVALFSLTGELIDVRHIELRADPSVGESDRLLVKGEYFFKWMSDYLNKVKNEFKGVIRDVIVEEPLKNGNQISTVIMLASYNVLCRYLLKQLLGEYPKLISVREARSIILPEFTRIEKDTKTKQDKTVFFVPKELDVKYLVWKKVSILYPDVTWLYKKNKKQLIELDKKSFDMSDAITVGYSYLKKKGLVTAI